MKKIRYIIYTLTLSHGLLAQNVGIGVATPTEKLEVTGNVKGDTAKFNGVQLPLNAGFSKVLVSDGDGNGTWQTGTFGGQNGITNIPYITELGGPLIHPTEINTDNGKLSFTKISSTGSTTYPLSTGGINIDVDLGPVDSIITSIAYLSASGTFLDANTVIDPICPSPYGSLGYFDGYYETRFTTTAAITNISKFRIYANSPSELITNFSAKFSGLIPDNPSTAYNNRIELSLTPVATVGADYLEFDLLASYGHTFHIDAGANIKINLIAIPNQSFCSAYHPILGSVLLTSPDYTWDGNIPQSFYNGPHRISEKIGGSIPSWIDPSSIQTQRLKLIRTAPNPEAPIFFNALPNIEFIVENMATSHYFSALESGKIQYQDGSEGSNKILTSDATGIASWQDIPLDADVNTLGTSGTTPNIIGNVLHLPTASASNTGVLSSANWSTFNGKIDGSGSMNTIAKFSASGSVSNSIITDNGTNVGIGTASPTTILDVNGNIAQKIYTVSAGGLFSPIPAGGIVYVDLAWGAGGLGLTVPTGNQPALLTSVSGNPNLIASFINNPALNMPVTGAPAASNTSRIMIKNTGSSSASGTIIIVFAGWL
jgi:hypothetical protein